VREISITKFHGMVREQKNALDLFLERSRTNWEVEKYTVGKSGERKPTGQKCRSRTKRQGGDTFFPFRCEKKEEHRKGEHGLKKKKKSPIRGRMGLPFFKNPRQMLLKERKKTKTHDTFKKRRKREKAAGATIPWSHREKNRRTMGNCPPRCTFLSGAGVLLLTGKKQKSASSAGYRNRDQAPNERPRGKENLGQPTSLGGTPGKRGQKRTAAKCPENKKGCGAHGFGKCQKKTHRGKKKTMRSRRKADAWHRKTQSEASAH